MKQDKLPYKMKLRIKKSKASVFIPKDFADLSGYDQILRVLRNMVRSGELVKLGQGVYAKSKTMDGKAYPVKFIGDLAREALTKLGVKVGNSSWQNAYIADVSNQITNGRVIAVNKRVRRKISNDGYGIKYEFMGRDYRKMWYNAEDVKKAGL
jgi:hypothetical protein